MLVINNPRRLILSLLVEHGGSISRIRLTKELFLLKRMDVSHRFVFLYDFFPYKHGPYSQTVFRDVNTLSEHGWLFDADPIELPESKRQQALAEVRNLPQALKLFLCKLSGQYGRLSDGAVISEVYKQYPEYTVLSERTGTSSIARPRGRTAIYTIGYQGRSLDAFLNKLIQTGIQQLIDIRFNPVSRRWGFSQTSLRSWCERIQVTYIHYPELGVPGELRKNQSTNEAIELLLNHYEFHFVPTITDSLARLERVVSAAPSALLCMENNPRVCHRSVVARQLQSRLELPVIDL